MLDFLRQAGKDIDRGLMGHTWENIAEGWRVLLGRSREALTHFIRDWDDEDERMESSVLPNLSRAGSCWREREKKQTKGS
jgi:hypothetical protein